LLAIHIDIDPSLYLFKFLAIRFTFNTLRVLVAKISETVNRLTLLNPLVKIKQFPTQLNASNALEIIKDYDIVIDGTDNFPTRYLVNDACVMLNKPFVYGAIHRFEGQVAVFNHQNSATYRDLFPTPPPPEQAPNCAEAGVLGVLPGIIGSMQALEAIKVITNIGEPLSGKLLIFDTLSMQSRIIRIPKISDMPKVTKLIDYEMFCGLKSVNDITFETLQTLNDYQLIDVRELHEYEAKNIGGELMPLSELEKYLSPNEGVVFDSLSRNFTFKKDTKGNYDPFLTTTGQFYPLLEKLVGIGAFQPAVN
jgi:adenylyltransferase/sulfurtransferase